MLNVNVEPESLKVVRYRMRALPPPPPHNQCQSGTTIPVCGGVEAYNERSLHVKYRGQGVQTSFYESTPSTQDPLGNTTSQGFTEDSVNARANIPNASKTQSQRFLQILQGSIRTYSWYARLLEVASSNRLKTTERPHRRSSLSHAHPKLSAEYCRKRRLRVQNRSAGCVLSYIQTAGSTSFCLQKQGIPISSTSPQVFHSFGANSDSLPPSSGDSGIIPYLDAW